MATNTATTTLFLLLLKLLMAVLLAVWACIWIIRPTQSWKRSWHIAEDRANTAFIGDYSLTLLVYCLPVLAVAAMSYVCLHFTAKKESSSSRKRRSLMRSFKNPVAIMRNPIGIVSVAELLIAALFIVFLAWTYYSNVSSDFKKMTPNKSLKLNRWQLKMMRVGVRIGSLSEACLVMLLLPVLRRMAVFRVFGVEFESAVRYHIWIGNGLVLLSLLHGISIMFLWAVKGRLLKEIIKWQSVGRVNIAGAITLATGVIIWITSLPQIRRKQFQLFYSAHHLYIVFFFFFLMHAGDRHFFLVFAGVLLFGLDKLLRIIQSRRETLLVSASILPCMAINLTLPKHLCMRYTPTSIIFIKVPSISKYQWHPFSITSSSNMDNSEISLLIKCHGQWTTDLYNLLSSTVDADRRNNIPVAIEGPYGPSTITYQRYKSLVLIAGGSGISPFLSILQDIASRTNEMNKNIPTKITLIYTVKKIQDLSMLALISPLLLNNQSSELSNLQLKLFVTQEVGPPVAAEKMLQDLSQVKTITFKNNASSKSSGALPVPEGLLWRAVITALSFVVFLASLVFLSHVFLHQEKESSKEEKKSPSWVGDLFVICSFAVAASCCTMVTIVARWRRKSLGEGEGEGLSHKHGLCAEMVPAKVQGGVEKHEVKFGCRPDLAEMLCEISLGTEEGSEVGVFVCGPTSMQKSVASFFTSCKKRSRQGEGKPKCSLDVHFISFSL
ncbi:ferric reduction oxidase 8, mitochondrial [Canna indica]|uniref:Ferric reduction oxidase 8, mitochondrial n=1 Tax=Canna indica TaxID=4628 RepID=A0AAQ3KTW7_9LILI|nr:ferric reduction oxidase 8, mitochondrial [Canna indica]